MLIYIQASTVQTDISRVGCILGVLYHLVYIASWVYIGCTLPFSIYMCTICFIEFSVAWQNSKPVSCTMHAFLQNAVSHCHTEILYESISKLYIYSAVYLSDARVTFFCKVQELRNPTICNGVLCSAVETVSKLRVRA